MAQPGGATDFVDRVNEVMLLYGSNWQASQAICERGFECRAFPPSVFGMGNYFLEHSSNADEYVKCKNSAATKESCSGNCQHECRMIIARVLLGDPFPEATRTNHQMPPPPYDSVLGVATNTHPTSFLSHREFVVYSDDRCYPEFLVTYRRVPTKDPHVA